MKDKSNKNIALTKIMTKYCSWKLTNTLRLRAVFALRHKDAVFMNNVLYFSSHNDSLMAWLSMSKYDKEVQFVHDLWLSGSLRNLLLLCSCHNSSKGAGRFIYRSITKTLLNGEFIDLASDGIVRKGFCNGVMTTVSGPNQANLDQPPVRTCTGSVQVIESHFNDVCLHMP